MADEKILSPQEMLQKAYDRAILYAEAFLKVMPKPKYDAETEYKFDFDPLATYKWKEETKDGGDIFVRVSDGAIAKFTKYSHIKLK